MKLTLKIIITIIATIISFSCSSEEIENETFHEKTKYLYSAIAFKNSECKGMPGFPLLIIDKKISLYGLNACITSIVLQDCPFENYPLICLEIFKYDVKDIGPQL
jgi:hypothetical protein